MNRTYRGGLAQGPHLAVQRGPSRLGRSRAEDVGVEGAEGDDGTAD